MKAIGVIPARFESTRFRGKPLADLCGKPVIQHVYESVSRSALLKDVIVATDNKDIEACVKGFGGTAVMTSSGLRSGTDRIHEAAKGIEADLVVNIQGDEPFIEAEVIDSVIRPFLNGEGCDVSTAAVKMTDMRLVEDPNNVKVVCDSKGYALYFSRSVIPYPREESSKEKARYFKHLGLYCFKSEVLGAYTSLPQSMLEETEKLEQLRLLDAGYKIKVIVTEHDSIGVDTKEDLEKAKEIYKSRNPKF